MKIIYITSESYIDHSYTIVKEINKHCSLKVFIQAKALTGEIKDWCSKLNAEYRERKRFRNPLSLISEFFFLLKIRNMKTDIIWFNSMTLYQAFFAKILIRNFIVILHDIEDHPESREKHGTLSARLTKIFAGKKICTASNSQAEIYKKIYGVVPAVFQLPAIDYFRESGINEVKISSDSVRFFFFGSIEKYKGIETLLDAAEILTGKNLQYELNIYGKLKYDTEYISTVIKKNKNVTHFNDFIDYRKIHSIYIQNDILILPYNQVTQCGPLLIGFSETVPSICSDLPGFREYVTDNVDGVIYNNTAKDLAEKMEHIIANKDSIKTLKNGIVENALKKFSMEVLAKSYMNNFRNFIKI